MEKVKVGIIGCGSIARARHIPEYASREDVEIIGYYSHTRAHAEEMQKIYGGVVYETAEELLQDPNIDAVSICTANRYHAMCSIMALEQGKYVICEKPMATTLEESQRMVDAEQKSGKFLMPAHNQRMLAAHVEAKKLLSQGAIGKILYIESRFAHAGPETWSIDGTRNTWFFQKELAHYGVLGDLGAHKIDLIRYLTGEEITEVTACLSTLDKTYEDGRSIDLEDNAMCTFRLTGDIVGFMHFSWVNYGPEDNGTLIYGTKGVMKIFSDPDRDIILQNRDGTSVSYALGGISTNDNQLKSGVIDEFIDAIRQQRTPVVTAKDGYYTQAVLDALEKAQAQGRKITPEYH